MGKLFTIVRSLVAENRYAISEHAAERLEQRGIMEWQAVVALEEGTLLVERPAGIPNPTIEVAESLPDGTEFKAVWSYVGKGGFAKLVTVHFFDE